MPPKTLPFPPDPRLGTTRGSLHAAPPMLDLLATSMDPRPPMPLPGESSEGATGRGAPAVVALGLVLSEEEIPARLARVEPFAGLFLPHPSAAAILSPIVTLARGAQ